MQIVCNCGAIGRPAALEQASRQATAPFGRTSASKQICPVDFVWCDWLSVSKVLQNGEREKEREILTRTSTALAQSFIPKTSDDNKAIDWQTINNKLPLVGVY